MKGKEGSGDPEGREAKSGLASSRCGLDTSGEKGFFADVLGHPPGLRPLIKEIHRPARSLTINRLPAGASGTDTNRAPK